MVLKKSGVPGKWSQEFQMEIPKFKCLTGYFIVRICYYTKGWIALAKEYGNVGPDGFLSGVGCQTDLYSVCPCHFSCK